MFAGRGLFGLAALLLFCITDLQAQEIGGASRDNTTGLTIKVDGVDEPVYRIGGTVNPPRVVSSPKLTFGNIGSKAGTVAITMVVTSKGEPADIKISKHLGPSEDARALEAAAKYKFKPATKDGKPVSVQLLLEI